MNIFYYIFIIAALGVSVFLNTDIVKVEALGGGKTILNNTVEETNGVAQLVERQGVAHESARATSSATPDITAFSAAVADGETGEILYAKNISAKFPLASITKLMSFSILSERKWNGDDTASLSKDDLENLRSYVGAGDTISLSGLKAGEGAKISDFFYSGLIKSANDAVSVLVRTAGFDFFSFSKEMNKRALGLKMFNTQFGDPTGLDVGNVGTAGDLVLLALETFNNRLISGITSQKNYAFNELETGKLIQLDSTNKLFGKLASTDYKIIAGKTGYLDESGYNLLVEVENGSGKKYIIVILGAASDESRVDDAYKLLIFVDHPK